MELTLAQEIPRHAIRARAPGQIRIGERLFTTSLIVTPTELIDDWPPRCVAELRDEHLEALIERAPEVLLLGTGERLQFPPAPLLRRFAAEQIGVEVMDTAAACRTWNLLLDEGRDAVAALML